MPPRTKKHRTPNRAPHKKANQIKITPIQAKLALTYSEPINHIIPSKMSSTDDIEEDNLYNLFVSEDYISKTFHFQDDSQVLLCSNMSSTDHDLTGQIVWPASILLTWFLHHKIHSDDQTFRGKDVLELGAGCGLAGFYLANHGSPENVTITDGNDIVCRLLQKNQDFLGFSSSNGSESQRSTVNVVKLLWGMNTEMRTFWGVRGNRYPDYLIGADIILWPNQIRSLLYTIRWSLFARISLGDGFVPHAFVSYVIRANSTTDLLYKTAEELGLKIDVIPRETFVPVDCRSFDNLQTRLFDITLSVEEIRKGCDYLHEEIPEILEQAMHHAMPC
jgi:hypothetical protein